MLGCIAIAAIAIGFTTKHQSNVAKGENRSVSIGFSILDRDGPSGITEVYTPQQARQVHGPIWISHGHVEPEPEIASARERHIVALHLRAWAARAYGGGLCVLVMRDDIHKEAGPAASCSPAERISAGASITSPPIRSTDGYIVGVVPNGVKTVSVVLSDGSMLATPVKENVYARKMAVAAASVTFELDHTDQITNMNTGSL